MFVIRAAAVDTPPAFADGLMPRVTARRRLMRYAMRYCRCVPSLIYVKHRRSRYHSAVTICRYRCGEAE